MSTWEINELRIHQKSGELNSCWMYLRTNQFKFFCPNYSMAFNISREEWKKYSKNNVLSTTCKFEMASREEWWTWLSCHQLRTSVCYLVAGARAHSCINDRDDMAPSWGWCCLLGGAWQCLVALLVVITGRCCWDLVVRTPGVLPNFLQCTWHRPPNTALQSCLAHWGGSAGPEEPAPAALGACVKFVETLEGFILIVFQRPWSS